MAEILLYLIAYLLTIFIAKSVYFRIYKADLAKALFEFDYLSVAINYASFIVGLSIAFIGLLVGDYRADFKAEAMDLAIYIPTIIFLMIISGYINDKILLRKVNNFKEIMNGNVSVALAVAGSHMSTGIILMSCVTGTDGYYISTLAMFAASQIFTYLFYLAYEKITPYGFKEEICNNNKAVGIAVAGNKIAFGILLSLVTWGSFTSWIIFAKDLALYGLGAIVYLLILKLTLTKLIFPGIPINKEIFEDKNLGVGIFEFSIAITFSVFATLILI